MNLKYVSPAPSFINAIIKDYKDGYSPIIEVCGRTRVSKTTKAFIFANWISGLLFKESWDWKHNTIISMDQLIQELNVSDEGRIYVMDEVQRQLAKKMWYKPDSLLFSLLMGSQAYKHFIIFLITPKAWDIGSDHATSINYVCPVHSRTFVWPYRLDNNYWDISLQKKIPRKFALSFFNMDIKDKKTFGAAFKDELGEPCEVKRKNKIEKSFTRLEEYKEFIKVNLKDAIMQEALEKRGLFNPKSSLGLPSELKNKADVDKNWY